MKIYKNFIRHVNLRNKLANIFLKRFSFSAEVLQKKMKESLPQWVEDQINSEYAEYQQGIFQEQIEQTLFESEKALPNNGLQLFPIQIKDQRLSVPLNYWLKKNHRLNLWLFFLKACTKIFSFPDMQFIIGLYDAYETKEFLRCIHAPVFAISRRKTNQKILMFPHVEWMGQNDRMFSRLELQRNNFPWEQKNPRLLWRGSTTGCPDLERNSRIRCVEASLKHPHLIDASFCAIVDLDKNKTKQLQQAYLLKPMISPEQQIEYKYLAAVDGHCFPGSFFWQLRSGSLIFKQESEFLEWYYRGLRPFEHYVPYDSFREENLIEKIQYYQDHDAEARTIAENALAFSRGNLTNEDILIYVYHLLKRYADLQKF